MKLKPDFRYGPLPSFHRPLRFAAAPTASPLGPLRGLVGTWYGTGFNVIWRPNSAPGQDHFLELNLTEETLEFEAIDGEIANRGLLQQDIKMYGVTYLQQVKDRNVGAGLHIEPGVWATVPQTDNPAEVPTVVRMASIPHGATVLAQGTSMEIPGPPTIAATDILPFVIGDPWQKKQFPESNLLLPSPYRSPPADIAGITQAMVDNPSLVLLSALSGQTVERTTVLEVSSAPTVPALGGGVANTAFLQGSPAAGPNARAALVTSTFWLEQLRTEAGAPEIDQLQYTQRVLLNFDGLSWPHVTVATLRKVS